MSPAPPARTLLDSLESLGPHPALVWYGEGSRVELSGHVLANWVIKTVNFMDHELMLRPGEEMVLDLPPHWKRLVLALAAWSLGATVMEPADLPGGQDPRVLATDNPDSELAGRADEVLALQPASLALRFEAPLPPLAHDWVQEVRAHADELMVEPRSWSGPAAADWSNHGDPPPLAGQRRVRRPLLLQHDGLEDPQPLLGALAAGRTVVGPANAVDAPRAEDEGLRFGPQVR